jgi:hypothetical protein
MAIVDLTSEPQNVDTSKDFVIIQECYFDKPGGTSLDLNGFTGGTVSAGHLVITDASGNYKLMPLDANKTAYAALPGSHNYAGVVKNSVAAAKPFAAILLEGVVNEAACPYAIPAGAKSALTKITFRQD